MYIKDKNIVIRSANMKDTENFYTWWNDGEVMEHAGFPNGLKISREKVEEHIKYNETRLSQLCIIEIDDVKVGECHYGLREDYAEIGIKLCEVAYQGRGYGTKILKYLINFLFTDQEVAVNKIVLDTNLKNTRAQHVYDKLGFQKLRVNIDSWTNQVGELQSSIDYELLKENYIVN